MFKVSAAVLLVLLCSTDSFALPSFSETREGYRMTEAALLDRSGEVIHEIRVDDKGRRLAWASLQDVSPALRKTIIHSEDRRFYSHSGVDWWAVVSSFFHNLASPVKRGASTITMQLVSLLDRDLRADRGRRTLTQKWEQMKAAMALEKNWTKQEILEAYLNLISFRGEIQGITAAARGIFGKGPEGLDESESVLLAALLRSPNAPRDEVVMRACALASSLGSDARCESLAATAQAHLSSSYSLRPARALAPHLARRLLRDARGQVETTIDARLQTVASEILRHHVMTLRQKNVHDGALLVVENKTGDILAYLTYSGMPHLTGFVDGVVAPRQAGSTLKPFLYELAFEKRLLTPASLLSDTPLEVPTARGLYVPQNYDNAFRGMVSARTGLASSLNIPAVRTLQVVGTEPFLKRLRELGFNGLTEQAEHYGPALALGTAEVSLLELVRAYRALASGGRLGNISAERTVSARGRAVMPRAPVFLVSDILADRQARSETFGLENFLSTRYWSAVKTGTSKDMRDNWCIGYSSRFTVGVWIGNLRGDPMWGVSGVDGAAPVWFEVMNYLHRDAASRPPGVPDGVVRKSIGFGTAVEDPRSEWFLAGTEMEMIVGSSAGRDARIVYPVEGTIVAVDPDIPGDRQRVFFEARVSGDGYKWLLNDRMLGAAGNTVSWEPRAGSYVLSLRDENGGEADSVRFEVRGGY